MSTPQTQRQSLYARLEEVLGAPHAETLMTYLPPDPGASLVAQMATLGDRIDHLTEVVERGFERVDQRFEQRSTVVDQRLDTIGRHLERVDERFDQMEQRFHIVRDDLRDQMRFYSMTTVGAMTALTAIYAGLLAAIT